MAKGQKRGNREAKKPKKIRPKTIAAAAPVLPQGKLGVLGKKRW